jgi:hypothetical protein
MLRMTTICAAFAAFAATSSIATARDDCGSGWYWNGDRCVPSRSEERLRTEQRLRDDFRDRRRDYRDRDFDRSTTGYSADRYRGRCLDGYQWINGRCSWRGRDRF